MVSHTGVRYLNLQIESIKHPSQNVSPGTVWSFQPFFCTPHNNLTDSQAHMFMLGDSRCYTLIILLFMAMTKSHHMVRGTSAKVALLAHVDALVLE